MSDKTEFEEMMEELEHRATEKDMSEMLKSKEDFDKLIDQRDQSEEENVKVIVKNSTR